MTNEKIDFQQEANKSLDKSIQKQTDSMNLSKYLNSDNVRKRIEQLVGENTDSWITTVINIASSNSMLKNCDPKTIVFAAIQSVALKLPLDKNLGFAYIVPYKNAAQFQMGYKGFIQLAMRSGQYKTMNVVIVHEGQLIENNMLTGEIVFDYNAKTNDKIIGYAAYFRLVNGYEKTLYMSFDEVEKHGKRFSQSYKKGFGLWKDNFDDMALKTVIKLLLSKWGILSVDMQHAIKNDQSVIKDIDATEIEYVDNDFEDLTSQKVIE